VSRWAAGVQYLGTAYAGWQLQRSVPSVQAAVQQALSAVAARPVEVVAAGRTDAGVHAHGQVIHFDVEVSRRADAWLLGGNSRLPDDVSFSWVREVRADFDARRSAVARRYRYVIRDSRARAALLLQRTAWVTRALDTEAMHAAAQALVGEHDFSSFRDAQCQSSTAMRCVTDIAVRRAGGLVAVDVRANAFLHHMVRNIVGTLLEVGYGKRAPSWVAEVLAARDRTRGGMNAPAEGLYFVAAEYPAEFAIPASDEFWFVD
jgi:tRNA pseudouridine38-40 synthase